MQWRRATRALVGLASICTVAFVGDASAGPQAPKVAARQQASVTAVCGSCHNLEMVEDAPRSYTAWVETVQAMVQAGSSSGIVLVVER